MAAIARVVLGLDRAELAEEVVDFLDRSGKVRVVATAGDAAGLARAVHEERPDAVLAHPSLVGPGSVDGAAYLAVATSESVGTLREALRSGASGFYVWPSERAELAVAAGGTAARRPAAARSEAPVLAVTGARGGAGATFVSAHLAAALARAGRDVVAIDGDPVLGRLSTALAPPDQEARTLQDVAALGTDLGPEELATALWRHPAGFRMLLAPPAAAPALDGDGPSHALRAARAAADVVVLTLPPGLGSEARALLGDASRSVLVATLDLASLRGVRRSLDAMGATDAAVVVNMARRSEVVAGDVERVAGGPLAATIPFDRAAAREWGRGRLTSRGPAARGAAALADALVSGAGGSDGGA